MEGCSNSDNSQLGAAHFLLLPYPIQGHLKPFMKLAHQIVFRRCKVTVLLPEFISERMNTASLHSSDIKDDKNFRIISVPDGLEPGDDHNNERVLSQRFFQFMPSGLQNIIKKVNDDETAEKFTCVIADFFLRFAMEIAEKKGLRFGSMFTSGPGILAMILDIPRLIEVGIVKADDGSFKKNSVIHLSEDLPGLTYSDVGWKCPGDEQKEKDLFRFMVSVHQDLTASTKVLGNWFNELVPSVECLLQNIVSVGPLLSNAKLTGSLWSEDAACLSWLNRQSPRSVVYVAFGSVVKFTQKQFDELAFGLELLGMPFLWVVRSGIIHSVAVTYPDGFLERVAKLGNIVEWAPQEEVLAHPSIACFVTHCGWNSILDAICVGIPMLCWPHFADQFYNKNCVCSSWHVGLELNPDENGTITRYEIKRKGQDLLSNYDIRTNALKLKELAQQSISKNGSSSKRLDDFIAEMRM